MPIYIEEQDKQLFEKNGFTYDDVKNTIDHYRGQGLSDDDIQGKINKRLEEWKTPKQSFIDFLGENLNNSNPYEDVALQTNTAFQAVQQPAKQISQPVEQFQNSNIPTYNELLKSVNNPNLEPRQNTIENRLNTPILSARNNQQVTDEQKPMVLKGGVREDVDLGNIGEIKPLSRFESFKNQLSAKKRLADEDYQKLKSEYDKMLAEKDTNSWTNKVDLRPATYINNLIGGIGGVANDVLPFAMSGYFDNIKGLTKDSLEAFKRGWQNTEAMRGNSRLLDNTELLQNLAIYFSTLGKSGALFNTLPKETQTLAISKFLQQNPAFARSILAGYTSGTMNSLAEKGLSPDLPIDSNKEAVALALYDIGLSALSGLGKTRLNPKNYEKVVKYDNPVRKGVGLSQREVYEPHTTFEYNHDWNAKDGSRKPKLTDNGINFTMGESSGLKYPDRMPQDVQYNTTSKVAQIAPNVFAKQQAKEQARKELMENLAPNTMVEQKIKAENKKVNPNYEKELDNLLNLDESSVDNPNKLNITIGKVSNKTLELARENGLDLSNYTHTLDMSGKNHIKIGHLEENEQNENLIPLTKDDLKNIPNIIYEPDNIEYFPATKRKLPRFIYSKQMSDGNINYVEVVQNKKQRLATKTMWKTKGQGAYADHSHLRTSEPTLSNNIIPQNEEKITAEEQEIINNLINQQLEHYHPENDKEAYNEILSAQKAMNNIDDGNYNKNDVDILNTFINEAASADFTESEILRKKYSNLGIEDYDTYMNRVENTNEPFIQNTMYKKVGDSMNKSPNLTSKNVPTNDIITDNSEKLNPNVTENNKLQAENVENINTNNIVGNESNAKKETNNKLTDSQQKQLDDLKAEYERRKDLINKNNFNEEQRQKDLKAEAMKYSAKKREIIQGDSLEYIEGGLTPKELENKKKYLNSNYIGKQVYVDDKPAKIIGNPFGKVKVQFENGEVKTVAKDDVKTTIPKAISNNDTRVSQDEIVENKTSSGIITLSKGDKRGGIVDKSTRKNDKFEVILGKKYVDSDKYRLITPTYKRPTFKTEQEAREYINNWLNENDTNKLYGGENAEIPYFMQDLPEVTGNKDINLEAINRLITRGTTIEELMTVLPSEFASQLGNIKHYKVADMTKVSRNEQGLHLGRIKTIKINLDAVGNNPYKFVKTFMHEAEHAHQSEYYKKLLKKQSKGETLSKEELDFMKACRNSDRLNKVIQQFRKSSGTKKVVEKFKKATEGMSDEEVKNYIANMDNTKERDIILKDIKYFRKYWDLFKEIGARNAGEYYAKDFKNEDRYIHRGRRSLYGVTSQRDMGTSGGLFSGRQGREYGEYSSDGSEYRGLEPTQKTPQTRQDEIKQRGAIDTLGKYDKKIADAVTDREYTVRGRNKIIEEINNMSDKEIADILDSDTLNSDTQVAVLGEAIKSDIKNGNVPVSKLNKWAVHGTKVGQEMQERKIIAPESVEEAVIKMYSYNSSKAPESAKKLLSQADKIAKELTNEDINREFEEWLKKQDNNNHVKQYSQDGDRLALLKAMERYRQRKAVQAHNAELKAISKLEKQKAREEEKLQREEQRAIKKLEQEEERKRKTVEQLVTKHTFGLNKKKRADLIDNILKLKTNDGLTADNICKLINKMYGIKEVSIKDIEELKKLSEKIKNATTQREKDIAKAYMQKYVLENSDSSDLGDKIRSIAYINMLGGTKQRLLDFISTSIYQVVRLGDNFVTLVLDTAGAKLTGGERVTSGLYPKEWGKGLVQGTKEGVYDSIHGINTGRAGETARYDLNRANAFTIRSIKDIEGKGAKIKQALENTAGVFERLTSGMVKVPDRAFFNARYNSSLCDMLGARGVKVDKFKDLSGSDLAEALSNEATNEEIEQALAEARENVYQRECMASDWAKKIRNAFNFGNQIERKTGHRVFSAKFLNVGDWAIPFIHTTSVISEDIVDRIGLGYIKGMSTIIDMKLNGGTKFKMRDAYNSIAKSIIGSLIIFTGVAMGSKKDNEDNTDREVSGLHKNSVRIGNNSFNAKDIPSILVPANLGRLLMSDDEHKIYKAILETSNAIAEQNPVLSKYNDIAKGTIRNMQNKEKDVLGEFIANTLGVPIAQLTQNAQLRNIREITDPYERETFEKGHPFKTQYNKFKNATPVLSNTLPIKYNAIGKPVMKNNIENPIERTLSATISGHRKYTPDETYNRAKDEVNIMKAVSVKNKTSIPITKINRKIKVNSQDYTMNSEEFSNFQKAFGTINYKIRKGNEDKLRTLPDNKRLLEYADIRKSAEEAVKIRQLGHIPKKYESGKHKGEYNLHKYTLEILRNYDKFFE